MFRIREIIQNRVQKTLERIKVMVKGSIQQHLSDENKNIQLILIDDTHTLHAVSHSHCQGQVFKFICFVSIPFLKFLNLFF